MKRLYVLLGAISLLLGIIGIFIPLLPTTPFLLLTAVLWMKGSHRLYDWLIRHRGLGPYIVHFQDRRTIPLRVKVISISLLWASLSVCAFVFFESLWIRASFFCLAAVVTWYILSYKTQKQ